MFIDGLPTGVYGDYGFKDKKQVLIIVEFLYLLTVMP